MKCNEIEQSLPEYLERSLNGQHMRDIEAHLGECAVCRELVALWGDLRTWTIEKPAPRVHARFEKMLESFEQSGWERERYSTQPFSWLYARPVLAVSLQAVFAMILLCAGFMAGRSSNPSMVDAKQFAAMQQQLAVTQKVVVLSMLQMQSANERLEGVTRTAQTSHPDPEVVNALVQTLQTDSSVDVRLAALDALRRFADQPVARRGMLQALTVQQSPLVQIALIDALIELHEKDAVQSLKTLQQDHGLDPSVRKHAEWGIHQLDSRVTL